MNEITCTNYCGSTNIVRGVPPIRPKMIYWGWFCKTCGKEFPDDVFRMLEAVNEIENENQHVG